ncbi:hypothetical protein TWF696_002302 [Orbilia brochopaga]|uniref:Zn(2)-C6 fungal-type domain-containing protein n=1 Tax=Orbilia brochopaga TaxID=3140254 RepID=A0AAV9U568_9PEZI
MHHFTMEHRPYRSHKVPACTRCRQRKIRCKIDLPSQPCLFCRERGVACLIPASPPDDAPAVSHSNVSAHPPKRRRYDIDPIPNRQGGTSVPIDASSGGSNAAGISKSAIIVGPAVAEDVEIVQRHMSNASRSHSARPSGNYATEEPSGTSSVVYVTVPKYRRGVQPKPDTGEKQREIIEQIFGPFKKEAIRLYFELVHPCFPIIGDELRSQLLGPRWSEVNSALLCNIYATIVPLWGHSEILRLHPRPDSDYVWNLAVSALQEDSTSPSFATILLCGINVIGRPSLSYVGNIANSSRTVALAHSFGLHRDPRKWNKPPAEKEMRVRMWWCVFIIDSWSSLSYGTPPNIAKGCYDVRLPERCAAGYAHSDSSPKTGNQNGAANGNSGHLPACCCSGSFYSLCSLTRILAEMLPMVYHLDPDPIALQRTLSTTAVMLREREAEAAAAPLSPDSPKTKDHSKSNLQFCYLSVKLLFNRLSLRAAWLQKQGGANGNPGVTTSTDSAIKSNISNWLLDLQISATKVLEFVTNLTPSQLQEFWLPYTSHLLVVATMILLRCAVETENQAIKVACAATLISLKDALELHRDNYAWELGDLCLERCAELICRVQCSSSMPPTPAPAPATAVVAMDDTSASAPGLHMGNTMAEDGDALQFLNEGSFMPFDPLGGFDAIDDIWQSLFGGTTGELPPSGPG